MIVSAFLVALAAAAPPAPAAAASAAEAVPALSSSSVVREVRYRLSAAVRPLLIFWIRAENIGGARVLWRSGNDGRRGYELLLGSDPRRAPRKINRWGWEREDLGADGALLAGVMRKSDEDSLAEARTNVAQEGQGGYVFKSIRSRLANGDVHASNTLFRVTKDYGYHDLAEVLSLVDSHAIGPPRVREGRVPADTQPGFLFAVSTLIDQAVAAAVASPRQLLSGRSLAFTFNAYVYDVRLRSTEWLDSARFGNRDYRDLVRIEFEHYNREKKTRERFTLDCGTEGDLKGVPVHVQYQPKWWIRIEGVVDEAEIFP